VADPIGVTKQSIYKFEKGKANPRSDTVLKLAEFFRVPYSYFYETESNIGVENVRFRDGHKLFDKTGVEADIKEYIVDYLHKYLQLEELLNIKHKFENPLADLEITHENDIEKAAKIIRKKWKMGIAPIIDVVDTLENKGVIVVEINRPESFEGLGAMVNEELPVVVLNENTPTIERKRFSALHELGHLILDFASHFTDDDIENLCNCFAGAVLLVDEALYMELGKSRTVISLTELKKIKEYYGISIKALIVRAKTSGFIDQKTCREWFNSYDEWHKGEKGKNDFGKYKGEKKASRYWYLIVQGVSEKKITWAKAAELSNKKINALKSELNLLNFSIRN